MTEFRSSRKISDSMQTGELMGKEHLQNTEPPTPEQIRRAQRAVATLEATIEEKVVLLRMLGIDDPPE